MYSIYWLKLINVFTLSWYYMSNNFIKLNIPDSEIYYLPSFYSIDKCNIYFKKLLNNIAWQQDIIKIFGKTIPIPRLQAFYGNKGLSYKYSNINLEAKNWNDLLTSIKTDIELAYKIKLNSVLLNLYRNGNDSNGWHSDDEPSLGKNPAIASLSFGSNRTFHLKHKKFKNLKTKIELSNGSLLIMKGETQQFWYHQISKTKKQVAPRINLTFRRII